MLPPFPFLRKEIRRSNSDWLNINIESDVAEKMSPRVCMPKYFHKLVKKLSLPSEIKVHQTKEKHHRALTRVKPSIVPVPATPKSTQLSIASTDKPLPPTPGSSAGMKSSPEAVAPSTNRLRRILAPIPLAELHELFSGAPHFLAHPEAEKDYTSAPFPSVAFPWDAQVDSKNLRDHLPLQNIAYDYVSALRLPSSKRNNKTKDASIEQDELQKYDLVPDYRERPNMLSMQGLERGTLGYCAALDMRVADYTVLSDPISPEDVSNHRNCFLKGKNGLRPMANSLLVNRLVELSEMYHQDPPRPQKSDVALYAELFTQILFPPSRIIDTNNPYSLEVQVFCLFQVLSAPKVWVDFSIVEWRVRLGQILWGSSFSQEGFPGDNMVDGKAEADHQISDTQRYWLLLQILIGCEILLRLDALAVDIDQSPASKLLQEFGHHPTQSTMWTLFLARIWFENIRIEMSPNNQDSSEMKPVSGWLNSFFRTEDSQAMPKDLLTNLKFHGRYQTRQLSGLLHFAEAIQWPNSEELGEKIALLSRDTSTNIIAGMAENLACPKSAGHEFPTRQNSLEIIRSGGSWQSLSYINGLMLPGEGLRRLLIATLLENDTDAFSRLGNVINPYGGFIYRGKSFWSSTCILGKVLAAGKGASECMGWISSNVLPIGRSEGWVGIVTEGHHKKDSKSRIWQRNIIEKQSDVIAGTDASSVLSGDFILPYEKPALSSSSVNLLSLELSIYPYSLTDKERLVSKNSNNEASKIQSFFSSLRFSVEFAGEGTKEFEVKLAHDVNFVTAHPCIPPSNVDILQSPANPSFRKSALVFESIEARTALSGHPLYKAFTYTKVPFSYVLSMPIKTRFSAFLSPPTRSPDPSQSSLHTTSSSIPKVLVIDCTEPQLENDLDANRVDSDIEVLARATCVERGWNALISRQDRVCLACSVREASALGWRVIIRLT